MLQRRGVAATLAALEAGEATLVLLDEEAEGPEVDRILAIAKGNGVRVHRGTSRDLWRMANPGDEVPSALAMTGRLPEVHDLDELLGQPAPVVVLDRVRYATNVGFVLRTAEVAGAAGVILLQDEDPARAWLKDVAHASMGATRFLPLLHGHETEVLEAIQRSGRPLVVAEDVGDASPWKTPMPWNAVLAVGAEAAGVSPALLQAATHIVRLPMPGFIPSYNLQVAATALLMETLRQHAQ